MSTVEHGLVSAIVPVFNGERFLAQALESVLSQDYAPIEVIVVDDGSTDGTAGVARSFDGVRCVGQENCGGPAAKNRGIAESRGEFCAFLDHDDVWLPGKLRLQVGHLQRHTNVGFVTAHLEFVLEPGLDAPPWLRPELLERPQPGKVPSNLVVRRSVLADVGPFDPTFRGGGDDVDWFARAADLGVRSAVLPETLLSRRVHEGNMTSSVEKSRADMFRALRASIARKREGR